jgi:hypothetical protein
MRVRGPSVAGGRPGPTAGRRPGGLGGPEPPSDRLGAGPGDLGPIVGEHHANQFGPPARVTASQGEDRLSDLVGIGVIECRGAAVAGKQAGISQLARPFQEMSHGARRKVEGPGER